MGNAIKAGIVAIFVLVIASSEAFAAESVWFYQDEDWDYYIFPDSINESNGWYHVAVMLSKDDSVNKLRLYRFSVPNDIVIYEYKNRISEDWQRPDYFTIRRSASARALWNAMKPYMRQKGIYYSESWK